MLTIMNADGFWNAAGFERGYVYPIFRSQQTFLSVQHFLEGTYLYVLLSAA